jgi:hypothetical protein
MVGMRFLVRFVVRMRRGAIDQRPDSASLHPGYATSSRLATLN